MEVIGENFWIIFIKKFDSEEWRERVGGMNARKFRYIDYFENLRVSSDPQS